MGLTDEAPSLLQDLEGHSDLAILELLRHMTDMARDDDNHGMAAVLEDALAKCRALHAVSREGRLRICN